MRVAAGLAIHNINPQDDSFVPVLSGAMRDGDGRLILKIGAMESEAAWAVPTLIELLSNESAPMRALAAANLGRIGPAAFRAKAALQRLAGDPNAAVQAAPNRRSGALRYRQRQAAKTQAWIETCPPMPSDYSRPM